jgi:hypothetical protein
MSTTDYVIDILLIAVIFRQTRTHELTVRSAVLPLILMAAAGVIYLRPSGIGGNDLELVLALTVTGIVLGLISGLGDSTRLAGDGRVLARAGGLSVIAWVVGMGFRFGFEYYAYHWGAAAVTRFSIAHDITGAQIWTTALVLMAFGQVIARVGLLQYRRVRLENQAAARHFTPRLPEPPATTQAH